MRRIAPLVIIAALALLAASGGSAQAGGSLKYNVSLVSLAPGTPYSTITVSVSTDRGKANWYTRVQLWVECQPDGYAGTWGWAGGGGWLSVADPIRLQDAYYPGAPCKAWVYQVGSPGGVEVPDSNVLDFIGP